MKYIIIAISLLFIVACKKGKEGNQNNFGEKGGIHYPLPATADSLSILLITLQDDTNKVNVLNCLARAMELSGDYDKGLEYAFNSKILAEKLNFQRGLANSFGIKGNLHFRKGEYSKALENQLIALKIDEEIQNKTGIGKRYGNMGNVNYEQGDYVSALENDEKALKIATELNDQKEIAKNLVNIGLVYVQVGNYTKALDFYFRGMKIDESLGEKRRVAIALGNIGIVYAELSDYTKALDYYTRSLKMNLEVNNRGGILRQYGNMGNVYFAKGEHDRARDYYLKALKIAEEIGDMRSQAINLGNLGSAYVGSVDDKNFQESKTISSDSVFQLKKQAYSLGMEYFYKALKLYEENGDVSGRAVSLVDIGGVYENLGNYQEAFNFLYRSLAISDSIDLKYNLKICYALISTLYQKSSIALPDSIGGRLLNMEQMRLRSLYYYKKFISVRDTLYSDENKKQIVRKEMNYEFDKKETATKAENDKKEALAKEELKSKEEQRNYFVGGFVLVGLLAGFIFRSYRQKQKANEIITHQKLLVEEKQKEILDSIHYAKRIQKSLLPTDKFITKSINRLIGN